MADGKDDGKRKLSDFDYAFFAAIELIKIELALHPNMTIRDVVKNNNIGAFDIASWQKRALKRHIQGELTPEQEEAFLSLELDKIKSVARRANTEKKEQSFSRTQQKNTSEKQKSPWAKRSWLAFKSKIALIEKELALHPELTIDDLLKTKWVIVDGKYKAQAYKIGTFNVYAWYHKQKKLHNKGLLTKQQEDECARIGIKLDTRKKKTLEDGVRMIKEYLEQNPDKTILDLRRNTRGGTINDCMIGDWNVSSWIMVIRSRMLAGELKSEELELLETIGITPNMEQRRRGKNRTYKVEYSPKISVEEGVRRIKQELELHPGLTTKDLCRRQVNGEKFDYMIGDWNVSNWLTVLLVARPKRKPLSQKDKDLLETIGITPSKNGGYVVGFTPNSIDAFYNYQSVEGEYPWFDAEDEFLPEENIDHNGPKE